MKENHEFNIRRRLCLVMTDLTSIVEATLISAPPFDKRKSASVR